MKEGWMTQGHKHYMITFSQVFKIISNVTLLSGDTRRERVVFVAVTEHGIQHKDH